MSTSRKSVRLSTQLLDEVSELSEGKLNFSRIVQKALRRWVRSQRRRRFADLIRQSAQMRTPEQQAEDREIVAEASQSGQRVLTREAQYE